MSVNSEFNKFIVKTKNADFYRPGEKVRIQFQNVDKGFKPILIDHPDKIQKIDIELIKPYLPSRKPLGKLVGELIRDILGSPILKELNVKIDIVERLKETLKDLTPKPGRIPDEVEIKSQVNKSGIRYESKLKQLLTQPANRTIKAEIASDLKGQLLDLIQATVKSVKNHPELNPRQNFSEFQQQIKLAVDSIELNQLSSRISTQENQALVLQIPNPFNSSDKTIQLFIREDHGNDKKGRNNDKDSYDMAFFLDLSSLGNIKINAKVGPDCLLVRMDVERDDVANYILENTKDFEQRMKNNDLITTVECCVAEKVKPTKDNLVELLVSQNTSILSLKT